ncbi:unnamed protein product [Prorocentrum cordatum]|uniref:Nucleoporin Nup133/Nup155-like N-terminal domain-containing protein n=1 Tax=Prorocentrum cordatum TaxID=2364126 RepID=A0ABN9V560_9DINO|nr:unnamed protein product [Polarella glacialis]
MASLAEPAQQVEVAAGAVMIDQAMCSSHGVEGLPARSAEWDDSLFELTCAVQSQEGVPPFVEQCWSGARHRASCGLIAEVHHAWVSVDSAVYLWDYREREPRVQSVPADATVMCVAACAPRRGIFDTSVQLLLVVATRLTVSLAGLAGPGAGGRPAVGALVPLDGYSAPADGALGRRFPSHPAHPRRPHLPALRGPAGL